APYYGEARDYTITIAPPPPAVTASPTSVAFGGVLVSSTAPAQTFSVTGSYLTPATGSLTITAPSNFQVSPDGSTWYTSYTISYASATVATTTVYVNFTPPASSTYTGSVTITGGGASTTNVVVSGSGAGACSGTPTAGTAAITPTSGSVGTTFNLSLSGTTIASGLTYQWQSSTDSFTFTNISGATNPTATYTGITTNTWFRCVVTCPTYAAANSTTVRATYNVPAASCTPTFVYAYPYGSFSNFSVIGAAGTSITDASTSTYAYRDLSATYRATMYLGGTYTATITPYYSGYSEGAQAWIDFNNNGTFETTESVGYTATYYTSTRTFTLSIPSSVATGVFRMRVMSAYYQTPPLNPCATTYNYGDCRDYTVVISTPPPAVVATPTTVAFGGVLPSSTSAASTFSMSGTYLLPTSGSVTVTAPSNFQVSPDGSTWYSSYTVSYTGGTLPATTVYVNFSPSAVTSYSGSVSITGGGLTSATNVVVTGTGAGACSATPSAGTTVASPTTASTTTTISFSLSGATVASGLTYQWQVSTDSTTFSNITGATNSTYVRTGISSTSWFRCVVGCPSYSTNNSTMVRVNYTVPSATCTPSWSYTSPYGAFSSFVLNGASGTSISDGSSSTYAYRDLTSTYSVTLNAGSSYSAAITPYYTGYSEFVAVWIDFSNDGTFQTSENVAAAGAYTSSTSFSISIPVSAPVGIYRMRVMTNYSYGSLNPCTAAGGPYYYGDARDYKVTIAPPPPAITATPSSVAFGGVLVSSSSTPQLVRISGSYLVPTSGNLTVTAPSNYQVSRDGSSWATSYTSSYTGAAAADSTYIRFNPTAATTYTGNVTVTGGGVSSATNIAVSGTGAGACASTPSAGTASASPTSGSTSTVFTLSLSGTTIASGLTYQWKSSSTGAAGSFVSISGATNASYSVSGLTATRYYKCFVGCPSYNTDSTAAVTVTWTLPSASCTGSFQYTSLYGAMSSFRINGAVSTSINDAATPTGGYQNRTSLSCTMYAGSTYSASVSQYYSGYNTYAAMWIDYNGNGTFESTEQVVSPTSYSTSTTLSLSIPSSAPTGTYRMRIVTNYYYNPPLAPCPTGSYPYLPYRRSHPAAQN
ncbi:MAG: hypothetical protein EBZ77_07745, partial [Chitinophagia bacterium]|nr:hypothetical protein [Chitinophagia bacterium]